MGGVNPKTPKPQTFSANFYWIKYIGFIYYVYWFHIGHMGKSNSENSHIVAVSSWSSFSIEVLHDRFRWGPWLGVIHFYLFPFFSLIFFSFIWFRNGISNFDFWFCYLNLTILRKDSISSFLSIKSNPDSFSRSQLSPNLPTLIRP